MNKEKINPAKLKAELKQFSGTERHHKTGFRTLSTDGVVYLAEQAGCFWLLDIVDSIQNKITEEFAIVDLKVRENQSANVKIHNGFSPKEEAYRIFHQQNIPFTDFPLKEIQLYVQNKVILLPSEY